MGQLPTLTLTRQVVVSGDELRTGKIWRGSVGPDGTLYLVVGLEREIAVFSPNGRRLRMLGGDGQGPGDFRSIRAVGFVGDTAWFSDPVLQRVTLYAPDGRLLGTRRIEKLAYPKDFRYKLPKANSVYPRALLPDGKIVAQADAYSLYVPPTSAAFPGIPLVLASPDGKVDRVLAWVPVTPDVAGPANNPSQWVFPPFANNPAHALSSDGSRFATVVATISDSSATAQVTQVRITGDTAYTRVIPIYAPPVSEQDRERLLSALQRDRRKGAPELRARAPSVYPPLNAAFLANGGALLIAFNSAREHSYSGRAPKDATRQYLVLDPAGKPVGQFSLPQATAVLHFDGTSIWASELGADDVPAVARYRLPPPPRR